jgi:hypothetical protein
MIECDKCPDKLRCTTGQKDECDRGFKLKMCCRKHLSTKKETIIRLLIDTPNELISGGNLVYEDICPMCKQKVSIVLQMSYGFSDIIKILQDEADRLRQEQLNDFVKPVPMPGINDGTGYPPMWQVTAPYKDNIVFGDNFESQNLCCSSSALELQNKIGRDLTDQDKEILENVRTVSIG